MKTFNQFFVEKKDEDNEHVKRAKKAVTAASGTALAGGTLVLGSKLKNQAARVGSSGMSKAISQFLKSVQRRIYLRHKKD